MKQLIIYTIISVILISCKENKVVDENIAINLSEAAAIENVKTINSSQIVDTTYYVKLETTENSLIGSIEAIFVSQNHIIIFNDKPVQSVLVFDKQGNFMHQIAGKGKAEGEFVHILHCWADAEKETIHIHDNAKKKVFNYTFDNEYLGADERIGELDYVPNEIVPLKNSGLLTYSYPLSKGEKLVKKLDGNYSIKKEYFKAPYALKSLYKPFTRGFIPYHDDGRKEIRVLEYFSDIVYNINADAELKPLYKLDLDLPNPDNSTMKRLTGEISPNVILKNSNSNRGVSNFLEIKTHIYYDYWGKAGYANNIYFKNQDVLLKFTMFENKMGLEPYQNFPLTTHGDYFVSVYEVGNYERTIKNFKVLAENPNLLKEMKTESELNIDLNFYEVLKGTKPMDNPILVFTRYKNNPTF